jgi:hypothetical protein
MIFEHDDFQAVCQNVVDQLGLLLARWCCRRSLPRRSGWTLQNRVRGKGRRIQ